MPIELCNTLYHSMFYSTGELRLLAKEFKSKGKMIKNPVP